MWKLFLGLAVISLLTAISCMPEGFKSSSHKLIKIKERQSSKDVVIMRKTLVNSPSGNLVGPGTTSKTFTTIVTSARDDDKVPAPPPVEEKPSQPISVNGGCITPNPPPLAIASGFLKLLLTHRLFILVGSRVYFDHISQILLGNNFDENNAKDACFRAIWESGKKRIHGYNQRALIRCARTGKSEMDITCKRFDKPFEDFGGEFRFTALYADDNGNVLVGICANNMETGGWAILSNERSVSPEDKNKLLTVVARFGFDPVNDILTMSYDNCARAIREDFQEGPCDEEIQGLDAKGQADAYRVLEKGVYSPLSSRVDVYASAWFLRSQPFKETEDLDTICTYDTWNDNGILCRGFNNLKSTLDCTRHDGEMQCSPDDSKTDSQNVYVYNSRIVPIWTDGEKYVLTYNCLSLNLKTWSLYSTEKHVENEIKRFALAKVADYGFDPVKSRDTSYDHCKNV